MSSYTSKELAGVGKAGSIAEESLMGVRTVQAFNGQEEMVEKYTAELGKGKKFAVQKGLWGGVFGGIFLLFLFTYFGGGIYYGGQLLRWKIIESPGDVFIVVISMLIGAYFLGLISPHLMVLLNARVAAATIYEIIDRVGTNLFQCKFLIFVSADSWNRCLLWWRSKDQQYCWKSCFWECSLSVSNQKEGNGSKRFELDHWTWNICGIGGTLRMWKVNFSWSSDKIVRAGNWKSDDWRAGRQRAEHWLAEKSCGNCATRAYSFQWYHSKQPFDW